MGYMISKGKKSYKGIKARQEAELTGAIKLNPTGVNAPGDLYVRGANGNLVAIPVNNTATVKVLSSSNGNYSWAVVSGGGGGIEADPVWTDDKPDYPTFTNLSSAGQAVVAAANVNGLSDVATSGDYNDLVNIPDFSIPTLKNTVVVGAAEELNFIAGSNITLGHTFVGGRLNLTINSSGGGSGEANTASSLGGGLSVWHDKNGVDLRFNSFLATDFNLASNVISIDYVNAQMASQSVNGFVSSSNQTFGGAKTFVEGINVTRNGDLLNNFNNFASTGSSVLQVKTGNDIAGTKYAHVRYIANDSTGQQWEAGLYGTNDFSIYNFTDTVNRFVLSPAGLLTLSGYAGTGDRIAQINSSGQLGRGTIDPSAIVLTSGSYSDPAWITSIDFDKISGITGTPDGTKFLRDDGTWQSVVGGGGGDITGGASLGSGLDIYAGKSGANLQFNTLNASDFNLSTNLISIDYVNSQMASHSQNGFLTSGSQNIGGAKTFNAALTVTTSADQSNQFINQAASGGVSIYIKTGNAATSSKYAYIKHWAYDATGQQWDVGLYGSNNYVLHNLTGTTTRFELTPAGLLTLSGYAGTGDRIAQLNSSGQIGRGTIDPSAIVLTSGSYADPAWITSLAYSKISGVTGNSKYLGTDSGGTFGIHNLPAGGSGDITGATNLGGGLVIYDSKSGANLQFNSFLATDFNLTTNVISIDYTNGQAATSGQKGFLTSTDWSTFNGKENVLTFGSGVTRTVNAIVWDGVQSRKNSAGSTYTRRRINFIEGSNITITHADDSGNDEVDVTIAGNAGTVTSFSAGDLSPLFTTSEATATTTPALSFTLSTQVARRVFIGPDGGADAAPTFRLLVPNDIPTLNQNTTGTAASVTGTNVIGDTHIRQSAALSVIGNSTNATANVADIAAGSDGHVLRRAGTALGFGTIASAGIADQAVTFAKIQNMNANSVLGRVDNAAGVPSALSLTMSILATAGGVLQLVNDSATPGNNMVYGTNGSGTKGWYAAGGGTSYTFAQSVVNSSGTVTLVNDTASPGNNMLYGTDEAGIRGWYSKPSVTSYTFSQSVLNTADNITLSGDVASPGNNMTYATNASGVRGWYARITAASQADQETSTSTTTYVAPATQQYHPSSTKAWVKAGITGNILASYNITSLTDVGTGLLTITINVDFSSVNWSCTSQVEMSGTNYGVANIRRVHITTASQTAGAIGMTCIDDTATTHLVKDPVFWHMQANGDQ